MKTTEIRCPDCNELMFEYESTQLQKEEGKDFQVLFCEICHTVHDVKFPFEDWSVEWTRKN